MGSSKRGDSVSFVGSNELMRVGIVIRQSFYNTVNAYLGVALGALNTMILFPRLFPEDPSFMGEVQTILAGATVYGSFGHLGLAPALVTFFPRMNVEQQRRYWRKALLAIAGLSLAVGLGWYFFVWLTAVPDLYHYAFPLALAMVYFEMYNSRLQAQQMVVLPSFLRLVGRRLIMTLGLLLLYWQDWGGDALMLLLTGGYLLHLLVLAVQRFDYLPARENAVREGLRRNNIMRYSLFIVMAATVTMVVSRIDVLMIRGLLGPEAVTLYTIAFFMGSVVGLPGRALSTSLRPVLSNAFARNDMQQVSEVYKRAAQSQFYINGVVLLFILANFNWVMLLLPESYRVPGLVVLLIGLSQVVQTAAGPNGIILQLGKRVHYNLYVACLLFFLTIILNWVLIPKFGLIGAGFSALLAIGIFNLVRGYLVFRDFKIKPYEWRWSLLAATYPVILTLCAYLAQHPFNWPTLALSNGISLLYLVFVIRSSRVIPYQGLIENIRKLF